jgi:hypothetical protein
VNASASADEPVPFELPALRRLRESVRHQISTAEDAAAWLAEQPPAIRRKLLLVQVRCPENKLLLQGYELPATSAFVRRSGRRCLMVPSAAKAKFAGGTRATAFWLYSPEDAWRLRCRCHRWVRVTAEQLTSGAPVVDGVSVVLY